MALNNLGCVLLKLNRPYDAALVFKSALLLDPNMMEAKRSAIRDV